MPKLRINLGTGDDTATVITIDQEKLRHPARNTRRRTISNNNNKARSNIKKRNTRRSKKYTSDESTDEEYAPSDNESE